MGKIIKLPSAKSIQNLLKKHWPILILLLFSVLIRVFIFNHVRPRIHTDSITYLILSDLDEVRTPGYPLFMEAVQFLNDWFSITPDYLRIIVFVQMFLLGILNCFLIYLLARIITKNSVFALVIAFLYNFDFLVMGFEYLVLTETLTITLLLLSLLFYFRIFEKKAYAPYAAGISSGLLLLTRPSFLVFFLCLLFLTALVHFRDILKRGFLRHFGKAIIIFCVFNLVAAGSWSLRNKIKYDYFGISTLMPYQLRHYTNRFFHKYKKDDDVLMNRLVDIYLEENCDAGRFDARVTQELGMPGPQVSRLFLKMNIKLILDNPGDYLKQVPESFSRYYRTYTVHWSVPNQRILLSKKRWITQVFRWFFQGYKFLFTNLPAEILMLIVMPVILLVLVRKDRKIFHLVLLIEGAINYNFLTLTLTCNYGDNMRYRVPTEPLIILIFLSSIYILVQRLGTVRKKEKIVEVSSD